MPNYQDGKIYVIKSYCTNNVYIGSTTQTLIRRFKDHKYMLNHYRKTGERYHSSFKILEYKDAYIEIIEEYPCSSKKELCKREGQVIKATQFTVNSDMAGRTSKEWYQDNKERQKIYRKENKERIDAYNKAYHAANRETINDKQRIRARDRQGEARREARKVKINCGCGSSHLKDAGGRHRRSAKHKRWVDSGAIPVPPPCPPLP